MRDKPEILIRSPRRVHAARTPRFGDRRRVRLLERFAGDLAAIYAALAASRRETAVIKDALHRWQSDQARARDARGNDR